jgi:hypothetical protein
VLRVTLGDLVGQPVLAEDEQRQDDVPAVRAGVDGSASVVTKPLPAFGA